MTKRACRTLQFHVASLVLCACALPEVATWIPPVETMPAQAEVAAPEDPAASDLEESDAEPDSGSNSSEEAGARDGAASTSSDAGSAGQSAAPAAGSAAAVGGSAGTKAAACVCAAGAPCCDGCNLLPDGSSCAFAGPAQCLDGGSCKAGVCTPKVKPRFCLVSNMCYREGAAAPRYDCLYCAPQRVQDRFSPRPSGTPCDDNVSCNGSDTCGPYGQCTVSSGSTCPEG